ncbi:hypothetical protein IE077_002485 [Cardiosporidium cionae]|uniref:Uncharacterized protein n=1 Tax=Cardiosporidium cionae TaxID=476202 RepID=A0ABQ7JAT0_9APIC|nr:hypothetical protein IE077_002485 [Cardiosporidium cionae]|eukprot:KAF8821086.1 hypothetical protein IE077_002485 [Cardiosporidium cionae]
MIQGDDSNELTKQKKFSNTSAKNSNAMKKSEIKKEDVENATKKDGSNHLNTLAFLCASDRVSNTVLTANQGIASHHVVDKVDTDTTKATCVRWNARFPAQSSDNKLQSTGIIKRQDKISINEVTSSKAETANTNNDTCTEVHEAHAKMRIMSCTIKNISENVANLKNLYDASKLVNLEMQNRQSDFSNKIRALQLKAREVERQLQKSIPISTAKQVALNAMQKGRAIESLARIWSAITANSVFKRHAFSQLRNGKCSSTPFVESGLYSLRKEQLYLINENERLLSQVTRLQQDSKNQQTLPRFSNTNAATDALSCIDEQINLKRTDDEDYKLHIKILLYAIIMRKTLLISVRPAFYRWAIWAEDKHKRHVDTELGSRESHEKKKQIRNAETWLFMQHTEFVLRCHQIKEKYRAFMHIWRTLGNEPKKVLKSESKQNDLSVQLHPRMCTTTEPKKTQLNFTYSTHLKAFPHLPRANPLRSMTNRDYFFRNVPHALVPPYYNSLPSMQRDYPKNPDISSLASPPSFYNPTKTVEWVHAKSIKPSPLLSRVTDIRESTNLIPIYSAKESSLNKNIAKEAIEYRLRVSQEDLAKSFGNTITEQCNKRINTISPQLGKQKTTQRISGEKQKT